MFEKVQQQAEKMAAAAKDGSVTIKGEKYSLTFGRGWVYEVTDSSGEVLMRFNTKRLSVAKQWLREHLDN